MSAAHTPGPWVAKTYSTETVRDAVGIYAGKMVLPIVPEITGRSLEECDANIRLIAAAPELLAALHALVGEADLGEIDHDDDTRALIERARDAIERATGVPV